MADWNSNQYLKFEKERTQPSADLISRLSDINPSRVLDIGCGPGNSTNLLVKRFKNAEILGVDSSDNMLEKAKATYPDFSFKKCILPNDFDKIDGKFDLIFSNACIHWIKDQELLIKSAFDKLEVGGIFAVQIPFIQNAPFYKMLYKFIDEKWQKLSSIRNFHNLLPEEYYDLLGSLSQDFSIWETTYYHTVSSSDGVIEWYKGSGLAPYLDKLNADEKQEFLAELKVLCKQNYPERKNGNIILKMPRMFFVAKK